MSSDWSTKNRMYLFLLIFSFFRIYGICTQFATLLLYIYIYSHNHPFYTILDSSVDPFGEPIGVAPNELFNV